MSDPASAPRPRYLFVTGRLAEFSLRQVLESLAPKVGFDAEVAVLPITVAALMTPRWIARHLEIPMGVERVILPGYCHGDLTPIREKCGQIAVEYGPDDLRELPVYFGQAAGKREGYGAYDIEILAEINHAPRLSREELVSQAGRMQSEGADLIDLGCSPGEPWGDVGDAVAAIRELGVRVSIDSFDPEEVERAVKAGAELVLSVNSSNRERAVDWGVEVVVIPDQPGTLTGLDESIAFLERHKVRYRIDPILEPIGFGFAASLGRYLETRRRYPQAAMLMGIGNLTELTDVDSAGVNTMLIGFCQELEIRSVLTTSVINWARSCVREIDLGRRMAHYAVTRRTLPKHLEPRMVMLRDPKVTEHGKMNLEELQRRIRDPNWRLFAEQGVIYALNHEKLLHGTDPFVLFEQMEVSDASHAFYLGYEMMKAKTALTLGKSYRQDQALSWGFLTEPEVSHRAGRVPRREQPPEPDATAADIMRTTEDDAASESRGA
jgi:dihydropteroate synthase